MVSTFLRTSVLAAWLPHYGCLVGPGIAPAHVLFFPYTCLHVFASIVSMYMTASYPDLVSIPLGSRPFQLLKHGRQLHGTCGRATVTLLSCVTKEKHSPDEE